MIVLYYDSLFKVWKATPYSNYNAPIKDARRIYTIENCKSQELAMVYASNIFNCDIDRIIVEG